MKCIDPETMTPADRLAELGELLVAGVQRQCAEHIKPVPQPQNRGEQLDVVAEVEAQCGATTELPR
ncbi:MAG: hypothetical protein K8J09_03885 [Planctomycetes bacterium]|nr:hypothetical protein [Planctomycetota bacterium]